MQESKESNAWPADFEIGRDSGWRSCSISEDLIWDFNITHESQKRHKIKDTMSTFKKLDIQFPNICKGYAQYQTIELLYKDFRKIHRELYQKIEEDIEKKELYADKVINRIFEKISRIAIEKKYIDAAVVRYKLGNPPGKENSYGDAINWEILLECVPEKEDLFFVSYDRDFRSPVTERKINSFLLNEWQLKKKSEIFFYTSLTMFLNEHIKDINLKTDNIKLGLIQELRNSGSFASTHSIIHRLNEFESWSEDQTLYLFEAADSNNQVYAIISDGDVKEFFLRIYQKSKDKIDSKEELQWLVKKIVSNDFELDEIEEPF